MLKSISLSTMFASGGAAFVRLKGLLLIDSVAFNRIGQEIFR